MVALRIPTFLPASANDLVRSFQDGRSTPVAPRDAASIVLARAPRRTTGTPTAGDLEIYFLLRHASMQFAASMAVFPGGGVDPRDFEDDSTPWAGPSPEAWAERLEVPVAMARALVYAAVRETFEESGVLLAGPSADAVVADTTGDDWEADRVALEKRELSFTEFLDRRELVVRADLLTPWARWITPEFEPRRFNTWFFLAELPEGQRTRDVSSESARVMWMPIRDAVAAADADELAMMPPQYCTIAEMYDAGSVAEAAAVADARALDTILPTGVFATVTGEGGAEEERVVLDIGDRLLEVVTRLQERLDAQRAAGGAGGSAGGGPDA